MAIFESIQQFLRRYTLHSPFFKNQNKYFDCSAKFQFSNITKILNLENRRMMIYIFLPTLFPVSFRILQFYALKYTIPQNYTFTILYQFLKYLTLSVSDEGYSRYATCAINCISTFYYYHCVYTSADKLLVPGGIIPSSQQSVLRY